MSNPTGDALRASAEDLKSRWKEYQIATEWGYEGFLRCPLCFAFTDDPEKHDKWHMEQAQ